MLSRSAGTPQEIGMSDVLTLDAMRHDPEAALTLPLPPTPSVELLDEARQDILNHLDELTCDLDDDAPVEDVRCEMERAMTRLLEISLRLPAARGAALTLPLPPTPSVELLDGARQDILNRLDELTCDLDDDAPVDDVRCEMERATTRLLEISLRLPAARAAEAEADAKDPEPDEPEFELPGEVCRDESPLTKLLFLTEGLADEVETTVRSLSYDAKNEQRFVALLLARRCLEMYKDKEGREYRLDQTTGAALDALFDEFEDLERGFGPWQPPAARNILCAAAVR
jgi:hypothetical protein